MDLSKGSIHKHIKHIALPASIGFFFNTMYNVTDTFFAGKISTEALAALSLSFPIYFIIIAMGVGIGTGATALISNAIGAKKDSQAHTYTVQTISFSVLISIALTFIGLLIAPSLFRILGAADAYLNISLNYMNIIIWGTVFFLVQNAANATLNALGDTKSQRNMLIGGFILNILLDPWFMFGGFGLPAMGVRGIALATVLIQVIGTVYLLYKITKTRIWKKVSIKDFTPKWKIFKEIAGQGIPASVNMLTVAVGIFVITYFISLFSIEGVAAYGIATRIEQIALIPAIGLNIALLAIAGQSNGAKNIARAKETWKITLGYGLIISIIGGIVVYFFASPLMGIFTDDVSVIAIGAQYLRIAALLFFGYSILFQTTSLLQGLKKPMYAIWIGLARQIVLPLIFFPLFATYFGLGLLGIWIGVAAIVVTSAGITLWYGLFVLKRKIDS